MEWIAFHSLEPFGPQAVNLNTGIVASIIANVNRKKDARPFEPQELSQGDFMEEREPQTAEEQAAAIAKLVEAFGAKRVKKTDKKADKKEKK